MFIFFDTETTGAGPDDRLCQVAFKPKNGPTVSGLFNPGKPNSFDAMIVHHITDKTVVDELPFQKSDEYVGLQKLVSDINNVIVARNAKFDIQMLQVEGIYTPRVICTLKLASCLYTHRLYNALTADEFSTLMTYGRKLTSGTFFQ